jgi:acetyltransferase-like isoleucine patch superfamily enzyme
MHIPWRYVSTKALLGAGTFIGNNTSIYGFTKVGVGVYIDDNVTIGYPMRSKIVKLMERLRNVEARKEDSELYQTLDELSSGSVIGDNCIIRRGTIIYEEVSIGSSCETGHNVLIRENVNIGKGCKIGSYTILDGYITIGDDTVVQSAVYIPPKVTIGSRVFIAPRVVFTNDRYPPSKRIIETIVEDDVVIGANSTIVAGIKIGKGAVIAAGSVITKSVEPYTVVAGAPAKPVMKREEYDKKKIEYELSTGVFPWR